MSISTRKIIHYSIKIENFKTGKEESVELLHKCFCTIKKIEKQKRVFDMTKKNKFHLLFDYKSYGKGKYAVGYFKSAKYNHCPDLIDKSDLSERKNPKKLTEGEGEKTHFAIGYVDKEALLLLESKRDGVWINAFKAYIEKFIKKFNKDLHLNIGLSVKGNFIEKLKDLERVTNIEIYTPYEQVSDTFGEDLPIVKEDIKEDAVIKLTAKRSRSIKNMTNGLYKILSDSKKNSVDRIRVYGKTISQSDTLIDTANLKDHDIISVELDDNKQVVTNKINPVLTKLVKELL